MKKILLAVPFIVLLTACGAPEVKATSEAKPTAVTHDLIENPGAFKRK